MGENVLSHMVLVKWHDATFVHGIHTEEACKNTRMHIFESLGYFIEKDETTMRIAGERNDQGEYRDINLIPTGSIVSITELLPSTRPWSLPSVLAK